VTPKKKVPTATMTLPIEEESVVAPEHLLVVTDPIRVATIDVNPVCVALPKHVVAEAEVTVAPPTPSAPMLDPNEHCLPEPPRP
jgi:hypothetical protein